MRDEDDPKGPRFDIDGDLVGSDKHVHYHRPSGDESPHWRPGPEERRYLHWLVEDQAHVNLRGIGAGEIQLQLADVYVPLSLTRRMEELPSGRRRDALPCEGPVFEISALFDHLSADARRRVDRHALILGHPGSGKSTAMRKLGHLLRDQARRAAGEAVRTGPGADALVEAGSLDEDALPVFVPLREFMRANLDSALQDFVTRQVVARSKGTIDAESFAALWERGRLVLLLDGLDEITDAEVRAGLCRKLNHFAGSGEIAGSRIVVTCRNNGYRDLAIKLDAAFAGIELRPLSPEQADALIRQWFRALVGKVEAFTHGDAELRADELSRALEDPRFADDRRAMYATPLILTLLCVMNYRSCKMPESRVEFYETCLRVLLESWPDSKREGAATAIEEAPRRGERPLSAARAVDLMAPIAYELHASPSRDLLGHDALIVRINRGLKDRKRSGREVFRWLREDAEIFEELTPAHYGFFHLGVQEYLAAVHIAMEGSEAIAALADRLHDSYWREVLLLAGALPQRRAFAPLMRRLLEIGDPLDQAQWIVLREVVREANFDPAPFVEYFAGSEVPDAQILAVLRLVGDRRDPELARAAWALADRSKGRPDVESAALQLAGAIERGDDGKAEHTYDVAVIGLAVDRASRRALLRQLRTARPPLRVWPPEGEGPPLGELDVEALTGAAAQVLAVIVNEAPWRGHANAEAQICLIGQERPLTLVLAPGATVSLAGAPQEERSWARIDQSQLRDWDLEALMDRLRTEPAPARPRLIEKPRAPVVDPITGIRLLFVPEGTFMMGSDELAEDSKPPHLVKVSHFWIGETPVTNRQYRLFVEERKHRGPPAWRDRRFNDPDQPVVTVSWDDAVAFCRWMSERTGWGVDLPSEAQWEFAARGTESRRYPWGKEEPDATRACFKGSSSEQTAVAGSYLAGMGPYGTLDQAGNVWEWCKDVWDPRAYRGRKRPPGVNVDPPPATSGPHGSDVHVVRGGCWTNDNNRGALAAAYRDGRWHVYHVNHLNGFRVVVARLRPRG